MMCPWVSVPITPPRLNAATAWTPAPIDNPDCRSSDGSQLSTKYRISRFMKNGIHSSSVPAARPSVKRSLTGTG